jgi:hypothetical protein
MNKEFLLNYMNEHFKYCSDGNFVLIKKQYKGSVIGTPVGWLQKNGYLRISIKGKFYQAHRLVWLFHKKELPLYDIDHINGNKSDNRIENLRDINHKLNTQNISKPKKNNALGILGVTKVKNKFASNIWLNGKQKYLGKFDDIELAELVYQEAKIKYHVGYVL